MIGNKFFSFNNSHKDFLYYAVLQFVVLSAFYYPFLAGSQVFFFEDSTNFFEPLCSYIGKSFASGRIPLWNPYSYCGMPQIAISSPGLLSPFTWLFAVFTFSKGLALIMIISQLVCGAGTFLLVASLGWGTMASVVAASIMAQSGYVFSLSSNYSLVTTGAFVPLTFWSIRQFALENQHNRKSFFGVQIALSTFMEVAGGRPEIWLLALIVQILFVMSGFDTIFSFKNNPVKASILKYMAIGLLFAAPILLPLIEWVPLSRRADGLGASETLLFSANWYHFLSMMLSHPLGDLQLRLSEYRALIQPRNIGPYIGSAYIGITAVLLSLFGIQSMMRRTAVIGGLCIIGVLFALGENVPGLSVIVEQFPVLGLVRFPSKCLFFVIFCFSLFAARGMRNYEKGSVNSFIPVVFAVVISLIGLTLFGSNNLLLPFLTDHIRRPEILLQAQRLIAFSLLINGGLMLVIALILRGCVRKNNRLGQLLTLVCLQFGLLTHAFSYYRAGAPADYYRQPSKVNDSIRLLAAENHSCLADYRFSGLFLESFSVPPSYSSLDSATATMKSFQYGRNILRPFSNVDFELPSMFGFEGAMNGEYYYLFLNDYLRSSQAVPTPEILSDGISRTDEPLARLLQATAVNYVVTQKYRYAVTAVKNIPVTEPMLDDTFFEMAREDEVDNFRIYRLKNAIPRAYLSYNWKTFLSRDDLIRQISEPSKSYWMPQSTTLLEGAKSSEFDSAQSTFAIAPLKILETSPEVLKISFSTSQPAILVLADQFYPGWVADIDGCGTPIIRCNGFMRGVHVPGGEHTVTFKYVPKSFWGGLSIAFLALIWMLILIRRSNGQKSELTSLSM